MSLERVAGIGMGYRLRDRATMRKFKQEQLDEERRKKEAQDKQLNDALAELQKTNQEYFEQLKNVALTMPIDAVDNSLKDIPHLDWDQNNPDPAAVKNAAQEFIASEPKYEASNETFEMLRDFIVRNNLDPTSSLSWKAAFNILVYIGAISSKAPEPVTATEPTVNDALPEPQQFTEAEIEKMSAEEYKRRVIYGR